jgi:hypothetical protein
VPSQADACVLVVAGRSDTKMQLREPVDYLPRNEVTPRDVGTVGGERVELAVNVRSANQATPCSPRRVRPDDDDVAVQRRPFALDAQKPLARVEDQVVRRRTDVSA